MDTTELDISTGDRLVTDVTAHAGEFCRDRGDGLLNLFAPHATAGLALIEVASGTEDDLADAIDRLLPAGAAYVHRHGSPGHGRDHVLPAFVSPSLSLPVQAGRVLLGTWQSIVLVDTNVDNRIRRLRLTFLAG